LLKLSILLSPSVIGPLPTAVEQLTSLPGRFTLLLGSKLVGATVACLSTAPAGPK